MQKETLYFFCFGGHFGYFSLASSTLNPPLLVSGGMLQSPCNLEAFEYSYMYEWICLILFSSLHGRPFKTSSRSLLCRR